MGYFYQPKYALWLLLQERDGRSIAIERLDDLHFEKNHRPTDLVQLKHHITVTDHANFHDDETFQKSIQEEWRDGNDPGALIPQNWLTKSNQIVE